MEKRKKLITEDTVVNIDEEVFKVRAEELICELFVNYVDNKFNSTVVEIKETCLL